MARQNLTVGFGIVALGLAVFLGAIHAFAPGHGKTVMAAYLVGQRGSMRQAAIIGLTVTLTHTAGVLLLGIILSASTSLAPEALYPWLGMTSGLMLAGIGAGLLYRSSRNRPLLVPGRRRPRSRRPRSRPRHGRGLRRRPLHAGASHGEASPRGPGPSGRPQSRRRAPPPPRPRPGRERLADDPLEWRSLVPLGLAGGLVPSPSAIVVLFGAIALGRAWFGVLLVIAYGLGMAITLTGAGIALVRARGAIERRLSVAGPGGGRPAALAGAMPFVTAACIVAAGLFLAVRGATQI